MKKLKGLFAFVVASIATLSLSYSVVAWKGTGGHKFWGSSGLAINGKTCTSNLQVWDQPAQYMMVRVQIGDGAIHRIYAYNKTNYILTETTVGPFFGYNTCYAGYDIIQN